MKAITKEAMIVDLRALAEKLSKTPTSMEMSRYHQQTGGGASHSTYCACFGSWFGALEAAGLDTTGFSMRLTNEELSEKLCALARELGRAPLRKDVDARRGLMPSSQTYAMRFGSWRNALVSAGLSDNYRFYKNISDEELLEVLRRLGDELGTAPTRRNLRECEWAPCIATYTKHFGSWDRALELAGFAAKIVSDPCKISFVERIRLRKHEAMDQLIQFTSREKRLPKPRELGKKTNTPCYRTCVRYFGSWEQVVKALKTIV